MEIIEIIKVILFVICLFLSSVAIENLLIKVNEGRYKGNKELLLSCVLWGIFYYLQLI